MKLTLTGFAVAACIALLAPGCGDNSADTDADASKPAAQMPQMTAEERSAALRTYAKLCVTCHGKDMSGGSGKSLIDGVWTYGDSSDRIRKSIADGLQHAGMPGFGGVLDDTELDGLVTLIRRAEAEARKEG